MTTPEQIQKLLHMTPDQYEMSVISNYMAWSLSHNQRKDDITQRLLVSQPLFNWWLEEYRKLEDKFLDQVASYMAIMPKEDAARMYRLEVMQMHKRFSKPLIYCAKYKTQNITNTITLN